jgi:hypothetical protein
MSQCLSHIEIRDTNMEYTEANMHQHHHQHINSNEKKNNVQLTHISVTTIKI